MTSRWHGAKKLRSKQKPKFLAVGSRSLCSKGESSKLSLVFLQKTDKGQKRLKGNQRITLDFRIVKEDIQTGKNGVLFFTDR